MILFAIFISPCKDENMVLFPRLLPSKHETEDCAILLATGGAQKAWSLIFSTEEAH